MKTGIYFLLKRQRVVYIGKTERWPIRLSDHRNIDFDEAKIFECDQSLLTDYENRLIRLFSPRHNIAGTNRKVQKMLICY
jgi:hypothetical protein